MSKHSLWGGADSQKFVLTRAQIQEIHTAGYFDGVRDDMEADYNFEALPVRECPNWPSHCEDCDMCGGAGYTPHSPLFVA